MLRWKRWVALGLLVVLIMPVLALAWLVWAFNWNTLREPLAAHASRRAGRDVALTGSIEPDFGWPVSSVTVHGLSVQNLPGGSTPTMLSIETLQLGVDLRSLVRGKLSFTEILLDGPSLVLERTDDGRENWRVGSHAAGATVLMPLPDTRDEFPIIDVLSIRNGRLRYEDRRAQVSLDIRIATLDGSANDARDTRVKGRGTVRDQALQFELSGGSVALLRSTEQPYPLAGELRAGSTSMKFDGTVRDPFALKGFDVQLRVQGSSAADLFPLTGIALLPTPPYELAGHLRYEQAVWTFERFTGRMGDSDLRGTLRWDTSGPRPFLTAKFASRRLALADLGPLIGVQPRREDATHVFPDVALDPARLAAMDADVEFRGAKVVASAMPLSDFLVRFRLRDRVLSIEPLHFSSGAGAIESLVTIDGTQEPPAIDSRWTVRDLPIRPMMKQVSAAIDQPNLTTGALDGTASLSGQGRSLYDMLAVADGRLRLALAGGTLSHLVVELVGLDIAESAGFLMKGDAPVPIRCMVADFTVAKGHLRTRLLVLDTDDTVVTGTGTIDLAAESLDLRLSPAPKDFSLLALRTPLTISGTLRQPRFGVAKSGLVKRGVAAAGLALLFPPAALAALIEPGTGRDADCKALLREARLPVDRSN